MANLTGVRSSFPNQIDIIRELYDLPINKRTQAQRYQELKIKTTLTPAEVSELNALTTELQDFIVTPETWNKFGDVVISTQKFFSENVFGFVENKQTEMNNYVDLKKTEMQTEIDKFNDRGIYNPSVQYFKNNFVTFNDGASNQTYLCLQDCVGKEPSSNPLFWRKLTIQGAKGDTGSSGANFVFRGTWDNGITFMKDEAVRFGGMLFVSKIDNNLDNSPSLIIDTDYWFRAMDITVTVRKMVGTRNVASQTATVNFITGEISSFNPDVDSLDVYMNSVRLTRGFDYNINPNNQAIDKINGTWNGSIETPVFFEFVVTKNIINNLIFKDGSALSDGTVTRNKLDVDTQAEINKIVGIEENVGGLNNLTTVNKDNLVSALNEVKSETDSHLAQLANQPYCKLNLTANQLIPNSQLTKVAFNQVEKDNDNMADLVNNQIIIKTAGTYLVHGLGLYNLGGTVGERSFLLYKNGDTFTGGGLTRETTNASSAQSFAITIPLQLNDILQLFARQNSGGELAVNGGSGGGRTQIAVLRIGD